MKVDTVAVIDWSGGNDTGPTPKADAIWAAVHRGRRADPPVYLRNRNLAEGWLVELIEAELAAGRRLTLAFDFPFGFPAGFAAQVVGRPDPLALWDWLEARIEDAPKANNRFDLAGEINAMFPGIGPFWGNALSRDIAHLPRKGRARQDFSLPERRAVENEVRRAFPCWQLAGAGAVGSQALMGLPVLARLRRRFAGQVAVWPFEPLDRPVSVVEVWPSLLSDAVRERLESGGIKDAHQVALLAEAIAALDPTTLDTMLDVDAPEEGWILGVGHERALAAAIAPGPARPADDCFALPPGVAWMPVGEALDLLRGTLHTRVGTETIPTAEADGRILSEAATARRANPPAANAAVDGYGFAHAALGPAPHTLPLVEGRAAAGAPFDAAVPAGAAIRILTGALLPAGVDTVALQEDVSVEDDRIRLETAPRAGANARAAGEDVTAGAEVLPAGRRIGPADTALLSAVGIAEVPVFRRLRVGVLSTGDEIAPPGDGVGPSRTFDANRPLLLSLAARWGHAAVDLGHVGDAADALAARLDAAVERTDVVLTSGGASAGDEDHVAALLRHSGRLTAWRIAIKPGRPLALGQWRALPVFGLPGNPVAAFVCALLFARPALSVMAGGEWLVPQGFDVPAAFEKRKKPGRHEYLRARLSEDGRAEVFASEGSGRISGLSWAEGLVELGAEARQIAPGDPVRYLPFGSFGV